MEVTPEMYAWLTDINVINPFGSLKSELVGNFILPEKTVKLLLGGKYFDLMLTALQGAYNKFYKLKLDYLQKLKEMKDIQEDQEYISNSVKYANWHLINEMLNQFGISYTEEQITQAIDGDREFLLKVITQIYYLCNQFLKHCQNETTPKEEPKKEDKPQKETTALLSSEAKAIKVEKSINVSQNVNASKKEDKDKTILGKEKKPPKKADTVNINNLDINKPYEDCSTALEFFILSLCKNMDVKPRQAVALLSNNRKYLSVICSKGFKGDFTNVKKWLKDLDLHFDMMMRLIPNNEDGLNVSYGTIGTALICPEDGISLLCAQLLNKMNLGLRMNWNWFKDEGVGLLVNAFVGYQKEESRIELLNLIFDFVRENRNNFFLELRKKLVSSEAERNAVLEMLLLVVPICKEGNTTFYQELQNFVFDVCLNDDSSKNANNTDATEEKNNKMKNDDLCKKLSIVSDSFYYFYNFLDEKLIEKIFNFYKKCIRNNDYEIIYSTAVVENFKLMEKFAKKKIKEAPGIYKNLVFLFLENFDNEQKRKFILENFEHFFNQEKQIPIDILLDPYIDQLNTVDNFALCDLEFIFKIIEHPRLQSKNMPGIIKFLLTVTAKNEQLSRTANVILSTIFEKKLINRICTVPDQEKISTIFIEHINNTFDLFLRGGKSNLKTNKSVNVKVSSSVNSLNNKTSNAKAFEHKELLLETPYDIMVEDYPQVNEGIYKKLISTLKTYRKQKRKNSIGLLAMLWYYPDHDDILLRLEEENKPQYESVEVIVKKAKEAQRAEELKNFDKRLDKEINDIKAKKKIENKVLENKTKIKKQKEEKIRKDLEERRKIDRMLSGADAVKKPHILIEDDNMSMGSKNIQVNKNFATDFNAGGTKNEHSNMMSAIDNATKKFMDKGALTPMTTEASKSGGAKGMKNNFMGGDLKKDDVVEKYGKIETADLKKKKENAMIEYKKKIRIHSIKNFILPEGTLIKILPEGKQEPADPKNSKKYSIFISKLKNYNIPLNLEDEEDRERKAIDGYSYEFRKNTKFYFKCYSSEYQQLITKNSIMKMLKDRGIGKDKLDLEELNLAIRSMFAEDTIDIDYKKFSDLLVQLSYLIFIKRRPTLTIGECYGNLIRRFTLAENTESTDILKKKMQPVINYILDKKENKESYNLPDGFKFVLKSKVRYTNKLSPHFEEILGESRFVCYEIMEDIIFDIFKTSIIEPYVELDTREDIEIEPEKIRKWTPTVTQTYVQCGGGENKEIMKVCCDALEEGFKKYYKGKNIMGENLIHQEDKKIIDEKMKLLEKEQRQGKFLFDRKKEIEDKVEQYKKEKKKKMREKLIERRKLRQQSRDALLEAKEKFKEVEERRKQLEEEKQSKIKENQAKKEEKESRRNEELVVFYRKQRRKLREQFKAIKKKKKEYLKSFKKKGDGGKAEEKKRVKFNKKPEYLQKDKEYCDFENNLNTSMRDLMKREDIKGVFDKYDKHLSFIYDIYSKIGYNKISFFSKEVISMDEFKQFLINFTVLGLLVSTEQMTWIYNKIAKEAQDKRESQVYLDEKDFKLAICYLAVYSRFTDRSRKLLPSDLDNTNGEVIEAFLRFLGLKTPFKRLDMENFINDRRGMDIKTLLEIQRKMKTDVSDYKKSDENKEDEEKKSERRRQMEEKRQEKKNARGEY